MTSFQWGGSKLRPQLTSVAIKSSEVQLDVGDFLLSSDKGAPRLTRSLPFYMTRFVAAVAQAAPVFMNKAATTRKACDLIRRAKQDGASILAFPESFIPAVSTKNFLSVSMLLLLLLQ